MGGAHGLALELCLTTLALPGEVLAIRLERIDFAAGLVPVAARGGVERLIALPNVARQAIIQAAGEASAFGQAVTAGRGPVLTTAQFRLDRLLDRLADRAPESIGLPAWNFHGVREEAAALLREDGADPATIDAVLGRQHGRDRSRLRGDPRLASVGAERWATILADTRDRRAKRS